MENKELENIDKQKTTHLCINLPDDVVNNLELNKEEEALLLMKNDTLVIKLKKRRKGTSSISLLWFLIPSLIMSVGFFAFFYYQGYNQIAFTGTKDISIASAVIVLGLISGMLCFIYFFIKGKKEKILTTTKDIYWRNFPAILLSFIVVTVSSLLFFFWLMGLLFGGITFDLITSTFLFLVLTSIINYVMIYMAITLTPSLLTNILIFTIIAGVGIAMITNGEQQWWQHNFSFLGTPDATRAWSFNITLIFSAFLLMALIDYLFVTLQKAYPKSKRLTILRILLILVALNFGAVGAFPYNEIKLFQMIHNQVANMLVYLIIILIITLRWLLPSITKDFLKLSYVIALGLILVSILWLVVGYLSLTAFELIAFILAFTWLFLLIQQLREMAENANKVFHITIE